MFATTIEKDQDVQMRLPTSEKDQGQDVTAGVENEQKSNQDEKPAESLSLQQVKLDEKENVIVVFGSESIGVTSDLKGVTSANIFIPPRLDKEQSDKSPFNIIDSLNVGVSAGIIINHLKSQIMPIGSDSGKGPLH